MDYRCAATSLEGFIQQLAVSYVAHGYVYFVTGVVPEGKDLKAIDRKLTELYGVAMSKFARARRKAQGKANVQYLRHERFWVLLATEGEHENFFRLEAASVRDARETPIRFGGYAVSYRGGHASVRIDLRRYLELKAYFLELARHRRSEGIEAEFRRLSFVPYAPIRRQLLSIFRAVNQVRRTAGFQPVAKWCVRLERRNVKVFEGPEGLPIASEGGKSRSDRPGAGLSTNR